jgi:hypothetical protein
MQQSGAPPEQLNAAALRTIAPSHVVVVFRLRARSRWVTLLRRLELFGLTLRPDQSTAVGTFRGTAARASLGGLRSFAIGGRTADEAVAYA